MQWTLRRKETAMSKEKPTKKKTESKVRYNISGLLQMFVVVSIVYSTYVVTLGTTGVEPKVMLVPQALYAAFLVIQKFSK